MTRRRTTTKVQLTVALGLMYKEVSEMTVVTPHERGARDELCNNLRMMMGSPRFIEMLAEKMDEVR